MRRSLLFLVLCSCGLPALRAQDDGPRTRIEGIRIGYRPYRPEDGFPRYKIGMWAPLYVDVAAGKKGLVLDDAAALQRMFTVETPDSDDVGTVMTFPGDNLDPLEARTFLLYVRAGHYGGDVEVAFRAGNRVLDQGRPTRSRPPALDTQLLVTLGSRLPDLQAAIDALGPRRDLKDAFGDPHQTRFAGFENDIRLLPDEWLGYAGVDMLFLSTSNAKFLEALGQKTHAARLRALARYVRRGGRLVVPIAWQNQALAHALLASPQWQPPLPVIPPANVGDVKADAVQRLLHLEDWGNVRGQPFEVREKDGSIQPIPLARLDPGKVTPGAWEILSKLEDGRPLIARVPYGLGSVTYLAIPLDQAPFTPTWKGSADFLKTFLARLGPRAGGRQFNEGPRGMASGLENDLTSDLHRQLDNFDVQVVPFGYVALFIILYILVVGPVDYLILKFVFRRLEWTWFTFPLVVVAVSVAAYYTAYALKGNDQKINAVDIVDIDLRTAAFSADPDQVQAYGRSFFCVLSPRIQNYTIGVEPNPAWWNAPEAAVPSAQPVDWLGRPDSGAFGMGRSGTQGLFRRPYSYAPEARGLINVPIPVWTTKSFSAAWETSLKNPFAGKLVYHQAAVGGKDLKLSGTLRSRLAVDLEDLWIFYGDRCWQVDGKLAGTAGKDAKGEADLALELETLKAQPIRTWLDQQENLGPEDRRGNAANVISSPTRLIKQIFFHEKQDLAMAQRNHMLRNLDLTWRLKDYGGFGKRDDAVREAILYGKVRFRHGLAQDLAADADDPLPTRLWISNDPAALPGGGSSRQDLLGNLSQDTYVRVILPVYPDR